MSNDEVFASQGGNIESRFLYLAPEVRFDCSLKNQKYFRFWPYWRQLRKIRVRQNEWRLFFLPHRSHSIRGGKKSFTFSIFTYHPNSPVGTKYG